MRLDIGQLSINYDARRKRRKGSAQAAPKEPDREVTPQRIEYGKHTRPGGTDQWNDPEFDFKKIAMCLATEGLFRRAVDKYVELIWRNGYALRGDDPIAVQYIIERFRQMAMVSGTPTEIFNRSMSQQVVTYNNCFLEKVRSVEASGGRVRVTFNRKELKPVAAYFVVDATSIRISKNEHGKIKHYTQNIRKEGVKNPRWTPVNMIHMVKDREAGLTFGTPMVAPVIDDIQALRRMEENIEMLVFNHSIPLYQYKVGSDEHAPKKTALLTARSTVREMPSEAMLITPYDHEIVAIGAEGRALRCEGYLEYYKNRIFAGLGVSEVAMGYSGSASRSAADTIEKGMYNTTREFQNIIKIYMETEVISELLQEGNFDPYESKVEWFFPEIDIADKVRFENHIINLYNGNLLTESESRSEIGREPVSDEERAELYFSLVELPRAIIGAVDEPMLATFGPNAVRGMMSKSLVGRGRLAKSMDMPSNQHGTKLAPGTTKDDQDVGDLLDHDVGNSEDDHTGELPVVDDRKDGTADITSRARNLLTDLNYPSYATLMYRYYSMAHADAVDLVRERYIDGYDEDGVPVIQSLSDFDLGTLDLIMGITKEQMLRHAGPFITYAFALGVHDVSVQAGVPDITNNFGHQIDYLRTKNDEWLNNMINAVKSSSVEIMSSTIHKSDAISNVATVFDTNLFRVKLGTRNELQRAYNIGVYTGGLALGYSTFQVDNVEIDPDGKCKEHADRTYDLAATSLDSIPPGHMTHPMCTCTLKLKE